MASAAHVAVDPATGHVDVLDYVTVEDVGRIVVERDLRVPSPVGKVIR